MRKFVSLIGALVAIHFTVQAQTSLLSENFGSGMPATWTTINNDHYAVANTNLAPVFGSNAWIGDDGSVFGLGFTEAMSCSEFSSASAQADRWLISPSIIIPAGATNVLLLWSAGSFDSRSADGYEVRLSPHAVDSTLAFTTTLFSILHESNFNATGAFAHHFLDLTSYAGDTIRLAWRNNSVSSFLLGVTDISLAYNVPNYNLSLQSFNSYTYVATNSNQPFWGAVKNLGFVPVTSFKFNYSVNGGAVATTTFTASSFTPQSTVDYDVPTPFVPASDGLNAIKAWISDINGTNVDQDHSNDTLSRSTYSITTSVTKKVLLEEFTGAWCGYCPDGIKQVDTVELTEPYAIPVAIHWGNPSNGYPDGMFISEGTTLVNTYNPFFPDGLIDRVYYQDVYNPLIERASQTSNHLWIDYINVREPMASPVNVSLINKSYDSTTRKVTVTVKADFLANVTGDYRFNLYATEDSVIGPNNSSFNQENYFSTANPNGSADPSNPLAALPYSNVGWPHMHVLRKVLSTAWGQHDSIPNSPTTGSSYTKTYSFIIPVGTTSPTAWNPKKLNLVGMVQEYTADVNYRNVLNSETVTLIDAPVDHTGIAAVSNDNFENVILFPNPTNTMIGVQFDLMENSMVSASITNTLGQQVQEFYNGQLNSGGHTINANVSGLPSGIYFVTLKTSDSQITRRFVVSK